MTIARTQSFRFEVFGSASAPILLLLAITIYRFQLVDGVVATVLLVLSLLAHEAGHYVSAKLLNVRVSEIGLCLYGAYTRREQSQGVKELVIAASGVLVNFLIAWMLWDTQGVLLWLAQMNAALVLLNVLPAFNSDGQRILRTLRQLLSQRSTVPA